MKHFPLRFPLTELLTMLLPLLLSSNSQGHHGINPRTLWQTE